jgi:Ni/Co efflux regulator RcnB
MKPIVTVLAIALSVLFGSTAMARDGDGRRSFDRGHAHHGGYSDRGHRGDGYRGHPGSRHDFRRGRGYSGDHRYGHGRRSYGERRFFDGRSYDQHRFHGERRFRDNRFYQRSWRRGDRLPSVFLSTRFVVNDFRSFNLYHPPRGYRWVRVERDAFLAGVTTGVVLAVVADRF